MTFIRPAKQKRLLPAICLLAFLFCTAAAASESNSTAPEPLRTALASITANESRQYVEILASDRFQGRETGKLGQWMAAKYIAAEYAHFHLHPAGDDGRFYQNFKLVRRTLKQATLWLSVPRKARTRKRRVFSLHSQFVPLDFTGENRVEAPVVFAGYGITAPEYHYDDYAGIDVHGKVVLVLRHEPRENDSTSVFDGRKLTPHAFLESKALNARRHGAAALLVVTDPEGGHGDLAPQESWLSRIGQPAWTLDSDRNLRSFPVLWIDKQVAQSILAAEGRSLRRLQRVIDATLEPMSFVVSHLRVHVSVKLKSETRSTQNVIGFIEGSDQRLKHEVVVVGAHFDHIGVVDGHIYHGADDNASGTAGLLEIAEAFAQMPVRPRRSVLFAAFSAEELGLLGSAYYVRHPVFQLAKTVAMINLDMISRNEDNDVTIIGTRHSPQIRAINRAANRYVGLHLNYDGEQYFDRSDQANFARHRIPVIFYNTDGHPDYHRPSDTADKIKPGKLARVARLAFLVAWELANAESRPSYQDHADAPNR